MPDLRTPLRSLRSLLLSNCIGHLPECPAGPESSHAPRYGLKQTRRAVQLRVSMRRAPCISGKCRMLDRYDGKGLFPWVRLLGGPRLGVWIEHSVKHESCA